MNKLFFSTKNYSYLRDQLVASTKADCGTVETTLFPDGERYQRIITPVEKRNVVLIGGTINENDTLELYDLACTLAQNGCSELTIVIPYFGYSTMERAIKYGEVVTAKTRALLLSSIPACNNGNKIILFDLHTEGLPHYFETTVKPIHVYCKPLIIELCKELAGTDFVLASTDAGRAKWVESLATDMSVDIGFISKKRISGTETEVLSINADVNNKTVVIYDDMIRTGGSLINAARAYKQAGANKIIAITTHGLFSNNALEKIKATNLFEKIGCTDTHINALSSKDSFLVVKSIDKLIAENC
ncbi:MAG: ribose-phosphate pyrophosphokinase [Bacteroidetes bacterium]|nr:ribose-phosphate pyrophosphokinase [Bacteroidota bacterium]